MIVFTRSESETAALGRELASHVRPGDTVLLYGDLGSGKTVFARGLAEGLGIDPAEVSSPTFTIVQHYTGGRVLLLHVDLYRLEPREVDDLGLDELGADGIVMIEWADRLPRKPANALTVTLRHAGEGIREITVPS